MRAGAIVTTLMASLRNDDDACCDGFGKRVQYGVLMLANHARSSHKRLTLAYATCDPIVLEQRREPTDEDERGGRGNAREALDLARQPRNPMRMPARDTLQAPRVRHVRRQSD